MVICEFCNSELSNIASLKHHQQKARYCLEKQNADVEYLHCIGCRKDITTKRKLLIHQENCVKFHCLEYEKKILENEQRYEKTIQQKDKQIQELQNKLENLAEKAINRPTTTTNNTTNTMNNNILNLAPLDMAVLTERFKTVIEKNMTEQHLLEGQEGIAKLIAQCFTNEDGKKLITCTDTSRGMWKSKDKDGNIIKDYKANRIAKVVKPFATSKADILIDLDEKKRNKIYEIRDIEKRKKERLDLDERDDATMRGMKEGSAHRRMYEERVRKRDEERQKDEVLEEQLLKEFRDADELYLINLDDDDKTFKLYAGKEDIKQLGEDSIKFSSSLISLV
jgi:hypothetical protein